MKLTTKTRYGVRAMFDIAYHSDGVAAQAKDIARREDIPLRYLEQIFQDLKRSGLVESKRGPRGGYTLKREAKAINLADIVVALQGPIEDMFILESESKDQDPAVPVCSRHVTTAIWEELAEQVTGWLSTITLADLVARGSDIGVPRTGSGQPMYFI